VDHFVELGIGRDGMNFRTFAAKNILQEHRERPLK
jgi:hypothetical protein